MSEVTKPVFSRIATEAPTRAGQGQPGLAEPPGPPEKAPRKKSFLIWVVVAALVLLSLVGWAVFSSRRRNAMAESPASGPSPTLVVRHRDFVHILRLSGTVQAVESRAVLAPSIAGQRAGPLVITKLAAAGMRVKKGDALVEFDRQDQIKAYLDKQAEYQSLVAQIEQKKAVESAARAKDETELKQAEDDLKKAELDMQKNEILSRIDAEKNREALEAARADLKQLRETFNLKRRAAQADIRILEIQRDRARAVMVHSQENAEKMAVRAPLDGLVVLNSMWKGGRMAEAQEGDQVRPGVPVMQVVDPAAMEVRVSVNQSDLPYLRVGQRAEVRLDAYPDIVFPAELEGLAPVAKVGQFSDRVRNFNAVFSIRGNDPKLMPDLSAAVDVELTRRPNVLVIPREALIQEKGVTYVQIKNGTGYEKRAVKVAARNGLEAVIESGLEEGTVIRRVAQRG